MSTRQPKLSAMVTGTRDRLIAAATELLDAGGPAAVTLRAVGESAGVSHNAPYKHFTNKEDLLAAIASRELRRQTHDPEAEGQGTAAKRLRRRMRGYVRWAIAHPERFKLTFGRWAQGTDELADAASDATGGLLLLITEAQAAGELPPGPAARLMALMLSLAHGAADRAIGGHLSKSGKGGADPEDLVDDLFNHLAAAVQGGPGSEPMAKG